MTEILAACGCGSGLLGGAMYVAGDMGMFSGKGTGALVGSAIGGMLGYLIYSRNTKWNSEFYRIFFGDNGLYKEPLIVEMQNVRFAVNYHDGVCVFKKIHSSSSQEDCERWIAIAVIACSSICAFFFDWATVRIKENCERDWNVSCKLISMTETSIGLMVMSGLFFAISHQFQTFLIKKYHS